MRATGGALRGYLIAATSIAVVGIAGVGLFVEWLASAPAPFGRGARLGFSLGSCCVGAATILFFIFDVLRPKRYRWIRLLFWGWVAAFACMIALLSWSASIQSGPVPLVGVLTGFGPMAALGALSLSVAMYARQRFQPDLSRGPDQRVGPGA
jgi:hypothetical protein